MVQETPTVEEPKAPELTPIQKAENSLKSHTEALAKANTALAEANAKVEALKSGTSAGIDEITAIVQSRVSAIATVESETKAVAKAEADVKIARADERWNAVAGDAGKVRDAIKAAFRTPDEAFMKANSIGATGAVVYSLDMESDLGKRVKETGFSGLQFRVDGFANATGPAVSIIKVREGTTAAKTASTASNGQRASRNAKYTNGSETFDSALDVVRAHGAEHSAFKPGPYTAKDGTVWAGWVEWKLNYKADASKLAKDLGFHPVTE